MNIPTERRLKLLKAGFCPIPLRGKNPGMKHGWEWQKLSGANDEQIEMWGKVFTDATNTGILTKHNPAFDIDILHPEAAEAIGELVTERFEERGYVPVRIGKAPKRAILFRTNDPFPKINRPLTAPDGTEQKIEFLADGQQIVVHGIHPDTRKPYTWHGGEPGDIAAEDLPYISEPEAQQLVNDVARLLIAEFGYKEKTTPKTNGAANPNHEQRQADWADYLANVIDHDALCQFAAALVTTGMNEAASVNFLRSCVATCATTDEERRQRRLGEIPAIVRSAAGKFSGQATQQPAQFTSPSEGTAFGHSWSWIWHGDIDPRDTRKYLIDGLLPETGTCLISGQWGTYKTFVADDLAASVMTGMSFINFMVTRKGGVLFFACEGQNEVAIRLTAAYAAKGGIGKAPFAWVENCPRLLDPNASKILAAMVKQAAEKMQREFGLPPVLAIIDTAGKAAGLVRTGDLNDDAVAKQIMKTLADTSTATGALFCGVAHFGKAVETGTKGSSSFEDDADVVLALLGEKSVSGVVTNPRLYLRKRRAGPNGLEFPFQTTVVDMGPDQSGAAITTLTIRWPDAAEAAAMKTTGAKKPDAWAAKSLRLLRQTLMNMLADCGSEQQPYPDGPIVRAVDIEIVRAEFYKSHPASGDDKAQARKKAFKRAVEDARDKGLIGSRDIGAVTFVWLATPLNAHDGGGA